MRFMQVLACYAAAVALNWVLPANLGTLAMLLMFTTIIAGATFAGVLGGWRWRRSSSRSSARRATCIYS